MVANGYVAGYNTQLIGACKKKPGNTYYLGKRVMQANISGLVSSMVFNLYIIF